MRYLKLLSFAFLFTILMSSGTKESGLTYGIKPGYLAPKFEEVPMNNEYVLLQFWAAYDPQSRMQNIRMNKEINQLANDRLKMVSVSFDESPSVFRETVKADQLNVFTLLNESLGMKSKMYEQYRLKDGFGNVLIDPYGVIIARNIAPGELQAMKFQ